MFKTLVYSTIVAGGLLIGGCSSDDDDNDDMMDEADNGDVVAEVPAATPGTGNSAYDAIVNNGNLSTLRTAIDAAGLADTLDNEATPFTIFAPNDAAFLGLDAGVLTTLLADPQGQLTSILQYHVIGGETNAAAATDLVVDGPVDLTMLNGQALSIASGDNGLTVGPANIVEPNSGYTEGDSAGVVHVIDAVLIPPQ